MKMKLIESFSEFVLNETLKTLDVDLSIRQLEYDLLVFNFPIICHKIKSNNIELIEIEIENVNYIQNLHSVLDLIEIVLINQCGYFPSQMSMTNWNGMKNNQLYNRKYLMINSRNLSNVIIRYEPGFSTLVKIPEKLYHLSIQEFEPKIIRMGLTPKSKSKLSNTMDCIYLCSDPKDCYSLLERMKLHYTSTKVINRRNKMNSKWIIYEIDGSKLPKDLKLYQDPNYIHGSYTIEPISPEFITIYDREI